MTAQDKILHVANKLGLTSLQNMQASTGAVYDVDTDHSGQIFSSASRHQNPSLTNLTQNQFEVNEALLIESIAFYNLDNEDGNQLENIQSVYGSNAVIVFDLIIGNKRTMKSTPVFASGTPFAFATSGIVNLAAGSSQIKPRNQIFLEGAGILIPPQVQWYVEYQIFNMVTGAVIPTDEAARNIGCYLFGTRVLLNFNTSI